MNRYDPMFNQMFNTSYINQNNYYQMQPQIAKYQQEQYQNYEVAKFVKAVRDMCESMKNLDQEHQQQALYLSIAEMAREFGWDNN